MAAAAAGAAAGDWQDMLAAPRARDLLKHVVEAGLPLPDRVTRGLDGVRCHWDKAALLVLVLGRGWPITQGGRVDWYVVVTQGAETRHWDGYAGVADVLARLQSLLPNA
jgi:hypothetical protein